MSVNFDLDLAIVDRNRETAHLANRGQRHGPAGDHIKQRAVTGALNPVAVELAFTKRTVVMRAAVLDRVQLSVLDAAQRDALPAHFNHTGGTRLNLVEAANSFNAHELAFAGSS
jgi:hypothetical protein